MEGMGCRIRKDTEGAGDHKGRPYGGMKVGGRAGMKPARTQIGPCEGEMGCRICEDKGGERGL